MVIYHKGISDQQLFFLLKDKKVKWAGNNKLKIYGTLGCKSGKRMSSQHRVFFTTLKEAEDIGFRPCGHCMREAYNQWKNESV